MYAQIVNGEVVGVVPSLDMVHPDLRDDYEAVPDGVRPGMVRQSDGTFAEPETSTPVETDTLPPTRAVVSKLEFMDRFSDAELAGIYSAAKSDVVVEVFMDKLRLAEEVDLASDKTKAAVQMLADKGLIEAERVGEILSADNI